ncbi:MAG: serine protease [Planctomycetota bacterium]
MPPARPTRSLLPLLRLMLLLLVPLAGLAMGPGCAPAGRLPASAAHGAPMGSVEQLRGDVSLVLLSGWTGRETLGIGSGVRIAPDLILTAAHVIDATPMTMLDARDAAFEVVARGEAPDDWAVLRVTRGSTDAPVAALGPAVPLGGTVTLHGFTGTTPAKDGAGRIVRITVPGEVVRPGLDARHVPPGSFVISDGAWVGMSGGPAVNGAGEVVGIARSLLTRPFSTRSVVQGLDPAVLELARAHARGAAP